MNEINQNTFLYRLEKSKRIKAITIKVQTNEYPLVKDNQQQTQFIKINFTCETLIYEHLFCLRILLQYRNTK